MPDTRPAPPPGDDRRKNRGEILFSPVDLLDLAGGGIVGMAMDADHPARSVVTYGQGITRTLRQIAQVIPCFTPHSMIATIKGEIPAGQIRQGDCVLTRDNGYQPVTWAGQKHMTLPDLCDAPHLRPVLIRKGALGHGRPLRDLVVSPNHRVLVVSASARLYFDESEVLVAAKYMVGQPGITSVPVSAVTFIHFLCARHELVLSDGAWTETFQPGDQTLQGVDARQRAELFTLFPDLATYVGCDRYRSARKPLRRGEAGVILAA